MDEEMDKLIFFLMGNIECVLKIAVLEETVDLMLSSSPHPKLVQADGRAQGGPSGALEVSSW